MEIYRKNAAAQIGPRTHKKTLCEPGQRHQKSNFLSEIYGKNAAAQIRPRTQTKTLCEPAQFRATLYGNLQDKCRGIG